MAILIGIVLPVFLIVAAGYAATFLRSFDAAAQRGLSVFVFTIALPVALFQNMSTTATPAGVPAGYIVGYLLGAVAVFLLPVWRGGGPLDRRALLGFTSAYSNIVLLGIPIVELALGPEASVALYLILAFHSPLFFTMVTLLAEIARGRGNLRRLPLDLAKALVGNILLMAVLGGIVANQIDWRLPGGLGTAADLLARAAVPGALFAMGAALRGYRIAGALRPALGAVGAKLVLHPALVALLTLVVLPVPRTLAEVAIIAAAMPSGVNCFLFARRYGVAEAEVATAILLSNLASIVTLTIVLALLGIQAPA